MSLHSLRSIAIGVPAQHRAATEAFYTEFGLTPTGAGRFATTDGGEQLTLVNAATRRLVEATFATEDPEDLGRFARQITDLDLGARVTSEAQALVVVDAPTGTRFRIVVAESPSITARTQANYNMPGAIERVNARAEGIDRNEPVRPRKLSHVVLGSPDVHTTRRLIVEGLGFKVSDEVAGIGAFLRCSTDHHNILVQTAPVTFLHHSSWQVDDVDEIGRGAASMLAGHPDRHIWGLGRHHIGSNFFWYLKDPAGNFAEYSSDIDVIVDDELWEPQVWSGMKSLMAWGPDVPGPFIAPDDLAGLIAAG